MQVSSGPGPARDQSRPKPCRNASELQKARCPPGTCAGGAPPVASDALQPRPDPKTLGVSYDPCCHSRLWRCHDPDSSGAGHAALLSGGESYLTPSDSGSVHNAGAEGAGRALDLIAAASLVEGRTGKGDLDCVVGVINVTGDAFRRIRAR